jgi:hypothetical protein
MENYIINECITNYVHILSSSGLTSGATIEFDISESRFCGTVGAIVQSGETPNISFIQLYNNPCECLSGITILDETLNFSFTECGRFGTEISIEASEFCSQIGLPTTGITYGLQFGSEIPFCATFNGLSATGATDYSYVPGPFSNCEECEQSLNGAFLVVSCDYPLLGGPVNATQFTEWPIGQIYQISTDRNEFTGFTDENSLCFRVTGTTTEPYLYDFGISGPFLNCEDCGIEPPRSAGTEYEVCEICCDCGSTGSTINLLTPPHPVYTDGYGTPVTQLNMVVLGGPNGLNS